MIKITVNSIDEMEEFAKQMAGLLLNGDVVSLVGNMGAGKTTFTQLLGKYIGINEYITSPTFSLVNTYYGDKELNHLDLYRLDFQEEVESIDIDRYIYPDGISIIEWAERASDYMPKDMITIDIEADGNSRIITINGNNKKETRIIEGLKNENSRN